MIHYEVQDLTLRLVFTIFLDLDIFDGELLNIDLESRFELPVLFFFECLEEGFEDCLLFFLFMLGLTLTVVLFFLSVVDVFFLDFVVFFDLVGLVNFIVDLDIFVGGGRVFFIFLVFNNR